MSLRLSLTVSLTRSLYLSLSLSRDAAIVAEADRGSPTCGPQRGVSARAARDPYAGATACRDACWLSLWLSLCRSVPSPRRALALIAHTLAAWQLDSPRAAGGGYASPRGRQPLTAGGSLNESKRVSNRPSLASQFPVQTTSAMSVLNAGSSKTVSQVMQEHSYASPRAAQGGVRRSSSSSYASPHSSSRGLVGAHR